MAQNDLGHEQYGRFAALFSFCFLFTMVADLGINHFATTHIASRPDDQKRIFAHILGLKIILLLIYPLFMIMAGLIVGYSGTDLWFLAVLALTQGVLQFITFFKSNFQANQYFSIDSFSSVLDKFLLILVILFLLYTGITLDNFIYARFTTILITMIILYVAVLKLYGFIKPTFHISDARFIILSSLPFAINAILYAFNARLDQVLLERWSGEREAGLYAAGYRWFEAATMYLWTIMPFFFAKFSAKKGGEEDESTFRIGLVASAVPIILVSAFVLFNGEKLFWLFTKSSAGEINEMTQMMFFLFITCLINGFYVIYGTYLNSTGHITVVSKQIAVSIVINILLNAYLIPNYGGTGAAISTVACATFQFLAGLIYIRNKGLMPQFSFGLLFKLLILSGLTVMSFYILSQTELHWVVSSCIASVFMLFAAFLLGIFKKLFNLRIFKI